jgi:aspartokinase-like uncharacterized kinase
MNPFPDAVVVKLGGSLYDLPDLGTRLHRWLTTLDTPQVLLVPGGGATANVIRDLDRWHRLGEEASHWLALRAMTLNAHFLHALLPRSAVVDGWPACPAVWRRGAVPILDAFAFAVTDEGEPGALPHCWDVTSDALAARAAAVGGSRRLILLKSVDVPEGLDWKEAAERGFVDRPFVLTLGEDCIARTVNLRKWPFGR